jgi:hypothetical protein
MKAPLSRDHSPRSTLYFHRWLGHSEPHEQLRSSLSAEQKRQTGLPQCRSPAQTNKMSGQQVLGQRVLTSKKNLRTDRRSTARMSCFFSVPDVSVSTGQRCTKGVRSVQGTATPTSSTVLLAHELRTMAKFSLGICT